MSAPRVLTLTTVEMSLRYLLFDQLKAIRDAGFEVSAMSAPGPWTPRLEQEGIRHHPWRISRSWAIRADLRAFVELYRLLRRERFDLVHTHTPKAGILGRVAARLAGVPCVVNTIHGYYATRDDRLAKRFAVLATERFAARFSDLELFSNAEDQEWALRTGTVPAAIARLPGLGIDVERFRPSLAAAKAIRAELGIEADALVVTMVGRIVDHKGSREFFAAARSVRARRPEVRFVVVGGPDVGKAGAITEAEMADAAADVVFTGWRDDVSAIMAASDLFVLPSWGPEGLPRVAMEAAATGLPMVLTDIRGCRDVGRHEREALLIAPRDAEALATAIERLIEEPDLRVRLARAARERALAEFDQRRAFAAVIGEYRRLLALGEPGTAPVVRRAREGDEIALARLHRQLLPEGFLPTLGELFLRRFHRALIEDPQAAVVVAEAGGAIVGFTSGVRSSRGFSRRFALRHGPAAFALAAPRLLRPAALKHLLETARHATDGAAAAEAEIVVVAVRPGHEGHGLGRELVGTCLAGLAALGARDAQVVVAADNERGNGLYASVGFERSHVIAHHDDRPSVVWVGPCQS